MKDLVRSPEMHCERFAGRYTISPSAFSVPVIKIQPMSQAQAIQPARQAMVSASRA